MTICHVYMTMCQSVLDHTFYFSCYFSHNQPGLQSYQLKRLFAIRSHLLVGLQGQDSLWPGIFGLFCTYPACIQIIQARRYRLHPNYTGRQPWLHRCVIKRQYSGIRWYTAVQQANRTLTLTDIIVPQNRCQPGCRKITSHHLTHNGISLK